MNIRQAAIGAVVAAVLALGTEACQVVSSAPPRTAVALHVSAAQQRPYDVLAGLQGCRDAVFDTAGELWARAKQF
jgi:hypothetical protein